MKQKNPKLVFSILVGCAIALVSIIYLQTENVAVASEKLAPYPSSSQDSVSISSSGQYKVFLPLVMKPYYDMSYYMITTTDVYGLGFKRGEQYEQLYAQQSTPQNGIVILDFGSPFSSSGNHGTLLFSLDTVLYTPQIKSAAKIYAQGVWNGLGSDYDSFLTIVIGTNSSGYHVTAAHGEAWGTMINELNSWLSGEGYDGQMVFTGGNDFETNYRPPSEAIAWVDGYSLTSAYPVYNYGNASGCPLDYPPTEPKYQSGITPQSCDTLGWTQEHVYHVSWGSLRAYPFPEIYNTQGANAEQWYRIALYKNLKYGSRMLFNGALSQFTACEQHRDPNTGQLSEDCIGTNNSVEWAHKQLQLWLSSDPYDRVLEPLQWKSDIMWYEGTP